MTWQIVEGECVEAMRAMPEASVDAVVCDPPYGLGFMGQKWDTYANEAGRRPAAGATFDHVGGNHNPSNAADAARTRRREAVVFGEWCEIWAREALRVLKPGGHLLAFGGTRTYHRLACAIEDAGFEIRDALQWLYGSGFPKSLDVSKAIDKAAGAEREADEHDSPDGFVGNTAFGEGLGRTIMRRGAPATPDAERWQGWGTALKPAHEPVVVARKPLIGTVSANVLAHGTGALNIDGCRIGTDETLGRFNNAKPTDHRVPDSHPDAKAFGRMQQEAALIDNSGGLGRWPANVILDEEAAAILNEQTGELHSGANPTRRGSDKFRMAYGDFEGQRECEPARGAESGGASRFFYCAKTSSAERNAGLDGFEKHRKAQLQGALKEGELDDLSARYLSQPMANVHPTVKPIDVMRWLVRLVTPPGGTVLDPFTGSGTTGIACALERFEFVGIEREAEYAAIARARLAWWSEHPDGMELVRRLEAEREVKAKADAGQLDLFAVEPMRVNGNGRSGEPSAERTYAAQGGTEFHMKPGRRR